MGLEKWRAEAPANIALIKYMGKGDGIGNRPANPSLSMTLDHLVSVVELRPSENGVDAWLSLSEESLEPMKLSDLGKERFLKHFDFLRVQLQIKGHFEIRSGNNFPSDCGIASSASSFAALTKAAHQLALDCSLDRAAVEGLSTEELSRLSRFGSGSSCRSFFTPWSLWKDEGGEKVEFPWQHLHHQVVLLERSKKEVSSSEAHKRVVSSELFQGRASRAEKRLQKLIEGMNQQDWKLCCDLVWADFWDMHALFETAQPPFGYMNDRSFKVLEMAREIWRGEGDGPMVTMDAGANVHLLYRPDQKRCAHRMLMGVGSLAQVLSSPGLSGEAESGL